VFDLLTIRRLPGNAGGGVDGLSGFDVMSVVLQIPKSELAHERKGHRPRLENPVIGIWDTVERSKVRVIKDDGTIEFSGTEMQVSRLGNPLVNELIIPLKDKDKFNASEPTEDGQFLGYVQDPEPARLLTALYGISVPSTPRADLATVFLTGIPGLNQ